MDTNIVAYTSNFHTQVKQLVRSVLEELGFEHRPELDADLEHPEEYFTQGGGFFVLEHQGRLIGTVAFKQMDAQIAEVKRLYVQKEFRGKGYGGKLLNFVVLKCKQRGFRSVILNTNERFSDALRLYTSRGFTEVRKEEKMIFMELRIANDSDDL